MKYLIVFSLLFACTKPSVQKTEGQSQPAAAENKDPEAQAPLTASHASLPLVPNPETGEVRAPYQPTPKQQRILDQLSEEAKTFAHLKDKPKLGQSLFSTVCASCHGPEGRGFGPAADALPVAPTNFHEWPIKYGTSKADIAYTLLYGRNDGVMPALGAGLKREEMWSLVYLVGGWIEARSDGGKGH